MSKDKKIDEDLTINNDNHLTIGDVKIKCDICGCEKNFCEMFHVRTEDGIVCMNCIVKAVKKVLTGEVAGIDKNN